LSATLIPSTDHKVVRKTKTSENKRTILTLPERELNKLLLFSPFLIITPLNYMALTQIVYFRVNNKYINVLVLGHTLPYSNQRYNK
jgi:hypothetical protein